MTHGAWASVGHRAGEGTVQEGDGLRVVGIAGEHHDLLALAVDDAKDDKLPFLAKLVIP